MSVWLLVLKNALPEAIAVLVTLTSSRSVEELSLKCLLFLVCSVLGRLIWNGSILIHGLGHTVAIATVDQERSALNLNNVLENRSFAAIFKSLLPFNNLFIPLFENQPILWVAAGKSTSINSTKLDIFGAE